MEQKAVEEIHRYIENLLQAKFDYRLDIAQFSAEEQVLYNSLTKLGEALAITQKIANDMSEGNLEEDYKVIGNPLAAPLKSVQSNLRHISWVASCVAAGDYNQRVSSMGLLEDSFNEMTRKLQQYSIEMERRLNTDYLTQLGNRRYFYMFANRLWDEGKAFSMAYIDLDGLKEFNDHFGHSIGDDYLVYISEQFKKNCVEDEQIFRVGGDEFMIVSLVADEQELETRLERIRQSCCQESIKRGGYTTGFSVGCMVANYSQYSTLSAYLSELDHKMYNAKSMHYLQRIQTKEVKTMENTMDKTGLDSRIFDVFSNTAQNRYLFLCNLETNVSRWSSQAIQDFDLPGEYMLDASSYWEKNIHPDDLELYRADLQAVLGGRKKYHQIEYRARNRDGNYVICSCMGAVQKGTGGKFDLFAGTITNHGIVDNIDPVTNLYNVYELLKQLRRLQKERKNIRLMSFGIHQFSDVNMGYGYSTGNKILQEMADKLQQRVRNKGQIFRLDGVKFAILFYPEYEGDLEKVFHKLTVIMQNDIVIEDRHVPMEISGASLEAGYVDVKVSTLFAELMHALTLAKSQGVGKLHKHNCIEDEKLQKEMILFDTLLKSIVNDCHGFYMVYQPQVNEAGECIGVESLLRWKNEAFGMVPPGVYISFLEKNPNFYALGLWILRTSLHQMKPVVLQNPDFQVSVNISYRQMEHYGFRDDVMQILRQEDFPASNLTLELTEHCQSMDAMILQQDIAFFQSQGIHISADDFGTGYSSFSLLKQLKFDCIKIDQSFVFHILEDPGDQIMVQAVIRLAQKLGIRVCVEGVEILQVVEFLRQFGPDYYQGYYFAKPLELADALNYIEKHRKDN